MQTTFEPRPDLTDSGHPTPCCSICSRQPAAAFAVDLVQPVAPSHSNGLVSPASAMEPSSFDGVLRCDCGRSNPIRDVVRVSQPFYCECGEHVAKPFAAHTPELVERHALHLCQLCQWQLASNLPAHVRGWSGRLHRVPLDQWRVEITNAGGFQMPTATTADESFAQLTSALKIDGVRCAGCSACSRQPATAFAVDLVRLNFDLQPPVVRRVDVGLCLPYCLPARCDFEAFVARLTVPVKTQVANPISDQITFAFCDGSGRRVLGGFRA